MKLGFKKNEPMHYPISPLLLPFRYMLPPSQGTLKEAVAKREPGERVFRIRQVRLRGGKKGPHTVLEERHRFVCLLPDEVGALLKHRVYAEDARIREIGLKIHELEQKERRDSDPKIRIQIKSLRTKQKKIRRLTLIEGIEVHEVIHSSCFFFCDIDAKDRERGMKSVCWLNKYAHTHLLRLQPYDANPMWGYKRAGAPFLQIVYGKGSGEEKKFSAHVYGSGCVFSDPESVGRFVELVLKPAARDHKNDPCDLHGLDMQVYKKNQCMRVPGSCKLEMVLTELGDGILRGSLREIRTLVGFTTTEVGPKEIRKWACLAARPDFAHSTVQKSI